MSKKVLLVIDVSDRELLGVTLVQRCLSSLGVNSILCSRRYMLEYYARYMPDAIVCPNTRCEYTDIPGDSLVFVLPSESGNGQASQILDTHASHFLDTGQFERVDGFFCWGRSMKETLLDSRKWRPDQLRVTGSPATDHWYMPLRPRSVTSQSIGMTTTFRALSSSVPPAKMNYFRWIDRVEQSGHDGTYFLPPEHAESWLFFEASLARVMMSVVRELTQKHGFDMSLRLHPGERADRYAYWQDISSGRLKATRGGPISEWLEGVSILYTFLSASALDAIIRGVPVVSLKNLVAPDALKKIPGQFHYTYDDYLWQVDEPGDIAKYAARARQGTLPLCREEQKLNQFLRDNFNYPRQQLAAKQIALEINTALDKHKPLIRNTFKRGFFRTRLDNLFHRPIPAILKPVYRSYRWCRLVLFMYLPFAVQLFSIYKYLKGLLPGGKPLGFTFQCWRFTERRAVARKAAALISASETSCRR